MKFIFSITLTAFFSWLISLISFLPWYSFTIVAFAVSTFTKQNPVLSFFTGFLAIFILWIVWCSIKDIPNEHLLSTKVAFILPFKGNYPLLLVVTSFIGGLLGGFSALTGSFFKK